MTDQQSSVTDPIKAIDQAESVKEIQQTLIKARKHLKSIPEFQFKYDESLDRGDRIERLLAEVRENEGWDDPTRVRGSAQELKRHSSLSFLTKFLRISNSPFESV